MITKQEVERIAKLARLGLTAVEVGNFKDDLSSILEYVEKLKEVDVEKTEPTSHPFKVENAMRTDEAAKEKKKLVEGYVKVKSIF